MLDARLVNGLVVDTLLRQGRFDVASSFIQVGFASSRACVRGLTN